MINIDWSGLRLYHLFFGKKELYAKDRVHLSFRGVKVLSDALERGLSFLRDILVLARGGGTLKNVMDLRIEMDSNIEDSILRVDSSIVEGAE